MLKKIRVLLAILSIIAVTLLFVDFTGTARQHWAWLAQIQFIPALLSLNIGILVFLLALTLVFGRVYCSVICPLGITQDIISWIKGRFIGKKGRNKQFKYVEAHTRLRLIVLCVFVLLLALGLTAVLASFIAGLIEPYSAYGRIASQLISPIYDLCNNMLAHWSERQIDNYTFYRVAVSVSIPILTVAIITLLIVGTMAWRGGRDYCNTICPVGTILGYLAKFSLLKPVINTDKCINCGRCARKCKAKCINAKAHAIDYTRCVACMDCINTCTEGAITYTMRRKDEAIEHEVDAEIKSRRGFMTATGLLIGATAIDALAKTDGGLTNLKPKQTSSRKVKVLPAGAISLKHVNQHCTGCQLCIQSCPYDVLKPTLSLDGFMQPQLDFTNGYCRPDCNVCSQVCPVGAFHPISEEEKSSIKVGTAVVNLSSCLSASKGEKCGSCASNCPATAITMIPVSDDSDKLMPMINDNLCIGCGACEYHCPVGTLASMDETQSAIHVEGILNQREI